MPPIRDAFDRIVPALLMALGVTLVASGLLSFSPMPVAGEGASSPSAGATFDPGDPIETPSSTDPEATDPAVEVTLAPTPAPSATPADSPSPTASPSPEPSGSSSPSPSGSPDASPSGDPTPTPSPTPRPTLPSGETIVVSRVRIPSLSIDLPVMSGEYDPPGNPGSYPLCDIAQYLTSPGFMQPYEEGTTYVFAHARTGMFLPLLDASLKKNGASMLGSLVEIYTNDGKLWIYEIFLVKRHATDLALAFDYPPGEHRLVLQTSEGGKGHIPKLQVAARLLSTREVSLETANPTPHPRICY